MKFEVTNSLEENEEKKKQSNSKKSHEMYTWSVCELRKKRSYVSY